MKVLAISGNLTAVLLHSSKQAEKVPRIPMPLSVRDWFESVALEILAESWRAVLVLLR